MYLNYFVLYSQNSKRLENHILLLFIQYLRQREVQYFIAILRSNHLDHLKFSFILGLIIFHKNSTISKCFFGRLWIKKLSSKSLMILKYKYIWPQNMHWKVILHDNLLKCSKFNPHLPKMLIKYLFFPECLAQSHFLCITLYKGLKWSSNYFYYGRM